MSPAALGCDLERIEPRSPAFLADFLNAEEQALVDGAPEQDRPRLVTLLWSAKESALKALRAGLRLDTRRVTVALAEALADWSPLHVRCSGQRIFQGWWRCAGGFVLTLVADPPPAPPITVPCRMPRPAIPSRSG
ncbi:MAG: 4-phosphopantetheinyl transferase family protein [Bryobacteraceae bacterium]|nr:4-phosphopantetheinyl transferase family protein [Bryobacteraceae bacterium]